MSSGVAVGAVVGSVVGFGLSPCWSGAVGAQARMPATMDSRARVSRVLMPAGRETNRIGLLLADVRVSSQCGARVGPG